MHNECVVEDGKMIIVRAAHTTILHSEFCI